MNPLWIVTSALALLCFLVTLWESILLGAGRRNASRNLTFVAEWLLAASYTALIGASVWTLAAS